MGKKTSIYMGERLEALVTKYARLGSAGAAITTMCDRYDAMMAIAKRQVKRVLTEAELALIVEDGMSTVFEPAGIVPHAVLADVEDMGPERLVAVGINRQQLMNKLADLELAQQFALVELIEELRPKSQ